MKKKKNRFPKKTALLLGAAALLLLGSTVGSTRAALTYYSENYVAGVEMSSIGITLLENDQTISKRNYDKNGEWMVEKEERELLQDLLGENEKIVPGKHYDEKLTVQNSGNIDSLVRVIVTKSWTDKEGGSVPKTTLDPKLIDLHVQDGNGWVEDKGAATAERSIWYLNGVLKAGESVDFSDYLRIDPAIRDKMTETVEGRGAVTIHTFTYEYDQYTFHISISAEAVQTHNAADAVKSAWGVDVSDVITNVSGN